MELQHHGGKFAFNIIEEKPQRQRATVTIGHEFIDALYQQAIQAQQKQVLTFGFQKGETPVHYIEQNFRLNIMAHVQELIFTHCVLQFLYQSIQDEKIVLVGDPELIDIHLHPQTDAQYVFILNKVGLITDARWKRITIKTKERKQYKDIDKQIQLFLDEEAEKKQAHNGETIEDGDWVNFELALHSKDKIPLFKNHASDLWVQVTHDEHDSALHELFLGRKKQESYYSDSSYLHDFLSPSQDMDYSYLVTIKGFVPSAYFSVDLFKHHFNLKDSKEALTKLIEVFSLRHDLSMRRELLDAVLRQLAKQYFFSIPSYVVDQQSNGIMHSIQGSPDYHVYKGQPDFEEQVKKLAVKQLKESIIMDALGYQEKITVSDEDIHSYLHLTMRARTRDFVYFTLPSFKILGQEAPVPLEIVQQHCKREKTLNHIINTLAKKARA